MVLVRFLSKSNEQDSIKSLEQGFLTPIDRATLYRIRRRIIKDFASDYTMVKWLEINFPQFFKKSPFLGAFAFLNKFGFVNSDVGSAIKYLIEKGIETSREGKIINTEVYNQFLKDGKTDRQATKLTNEIHRDFNLYNKAGYNPLSKWIAGAAKKNSNELLEMHHRAFTFSKEAADKNKENKTSGGRFFLVSMNLDFRPKIFDYLLTLIEPNCKEILKAMLFKNIPLSIQSDLQESLNRLKLINDTVHKIKKVTDIIFKTLDSLIEYSKDITIDPDYKLELPEESIENYQQMKNLYEETLKQYNNFHEKQLLEIKQKSPTEGSCDALVLGNRRVANGGGNYGMLRIRPEFEALYRNRPGGLNARVPIAEHLMNALPGGVHGLYNRNSNRPVWAHKPFNNTTITSTRVRATMLELTNKLPL